MILVDHRNEYVKLKPGDFILLRNIGSTLEVRFFAKTRQHIEPLSFRSEDGLKRDALVMNAGEHRLAIIELIEAVSGFTCQSRWADPGDERYVLYASDPATLSLPRNEALFVELDSISPSRRLQTCCANERIRFIGDLIQWEPKDLRRLRNFGPKTLKEARELVEQFGFTLGMTLSPEELASFNAERARRTTL